MTIYGHGGSIKFYMIQKIVKHRDNIWSMIIFGCFLLYFIRNVLPLNDLFYCLFFLSNVFLIVVLFFNPNYLRDSFNKALDLFRANRIISLCIILIVSFDLINSLSIGVPYFIRRYWLTIQFFDIFLVLCIWRINNNYSKEYLLRKMMYYIFIGSFFTFIVVFVNFLFPLFETVFLSEISTISDYNAFSRFFLFSLCIGTNYVVTDETLSKRRKFLYFVLLMLMTSIVVFLSTSRRSLAIFVLLSIVCNVYFNMDYLKKSITLRYKICSVLLIFTLFLMTIATGYGIHDILLDFVSKNDNMKIERMQKLNGVDSAREITEYYVMNRTSKGHDVIIDTSKSNTIKRAVKSTKDGNFIGKRTLIWSIAINEIKKYKTSELIFGKGLAFSSKIYSTKSSLKILARDYDIKTIKSGGMHPHNFILQHLLEGGIVRLSLELILVFAFTYRLTIGYKRIKPYWLMMSTMFALITINILISYNKGFLGDDYAGYFLVAYLLIMDCQYEYK